MLYWVHLDIIQYVLPRSDHISEKSSYISAGNRTTHSWITVCVSPVPSINKTDHHDITEILLKVALSIINRTDRTVIVFIIWWNCLVFGWLMSPGPKSYSEKSSYISAGNRTTHSWITVCVRLRVIYFSIFGIQQ
jgi:hypothetical protein